MLPVALNNGFFVSQTHFNTRSHLDSTDVFQMMAHSGNGQQVTDLGVIDLFINSGYYPEKKSSFAMSAERMMLETHLFKWSHPISQEEFYVLEDLSFVSEAGRGGEKFKVKMNSKKYDNGYILSPDPQGMFQVLVTTDEIVKDGDGHIFTFQLVGSNASDMFFPKEFLQQGTKFYFITTVGTEYSQTYSSIPTFGGGERTFSSYVGKSDAQLHYSITRDAAMTSLPNKVLVPYDQFLEGIEMFEFSPGTLGWEISYKTPEEKMGNSIYDAYSRVHGTMARGRQAMVRDAALYSWTPKVEMIAVKLLDQMRDMEAIYGTGGTVDFDGPTKGQRVLGLFHQFMLGANVSYSLQNFSLDFLENIITQRNQGRREYYGSDPNETVFTFRTGRGGIAMAQAEILKYPARAGLLWNTEGIIKNIGGNNANLHFETPSFGSWRMKNGMGTIKLVYEASLDPQTTNALVNPMVTTTNGMGGHFLSSYIFILESLAADVEGGNVKELLYGPDWEVRKSVTQGKLAYPGLGTQTFWQRSNHSAGFEVDFEQRHKSYWLCDPTKSLVVKPYNPYTGKPIFQYN